MIVNLHDYERASQKKLEKVIYDFIAEGAHDEITRQKNESAYQSFSFRPRVLGGGFDGKTKTTFFNQISSMPLLFSPTAFHGLVHEEGELATARAACLEGIPMIVSMASTKHLHEITNASGQQSGQFWFQMYVQKNQKMNQHLIQLAQSANCQALVITVDSAVFGQRERSIKNRFNDLPKGLTCPNLSIDGAKPASIEFNEKLDWNDIRCIQSMTSLPIVLKGIAHPKDTEIALKHGIAALIVSNHGGRQLDGVASTLTLLPDIINVTQHEIPVIVDGGIRRGSDIVKALALGAFAVGIGRSVLWGLSVNGQEGVQEVVSILRRELIHTLMLCGCPSLSDLNPSYLFKEV